MIRKQADLWEFEVRLLCLYIRFHASQGYLAEVVRPLKKKKKKIKTKTGY